MREWLRNLRIEKGYTMKSLGEKLGVSESYYCSIENGTRQKKMDISIMIALSSALDIPIAEIVQMESKLQGNLDARTE